MKNLFEEFFFDINVGIYTIHFCHIHFLHFYNIHFCHMALTFLINPNHKGSTCLRKVQQGLGLGLSLGLGIKLGLKRIARGNIQRRKLRATMKTNLVR